MEESGCHDLQYTNNCKELWRAVLAKCVRDVVATRVSIKNPERTANARHRAKAWLLSKDTGVASFSWVCSAIGYDSKAFLERLMEKYKLIEPVYFANYKKVTGLTTTVLAALAENSARIGAKKQLKI